MKVNKRTSALFQTAVIVSEMQLIFICKEFLQTVMHQGPLHLEKPRVHLQVACCCPLCFYCPLQMIPRAFMVISRTSSPLVSNIANKWQKVTKW